MAVLDQVVRPEFAAYCGDSCELLPLFPSASFDIGMESPPFGGIHQYSSSTRDLSNCVSYEDFLDHYEFIVKEKARLIKPGCMAVIHLMDPVIDGVLRDLQGDVIRLHRKHGFHFFDRKMVWKDPLKEAFRTRALALRHNQLLKDSTPCRSALPDYLVVMQREGTRKVPIAHPQGLLEYFGELDPQKRERMGYLPIPTDVLRAATEWKGNPNDNPFSHWVFRRYASPSWLDVRQGFVLDYKEARESEEERHIHPTQLDDWLRALTLWSNPGDRVLTPFMGVGSEVWAAAYLKRVGVGIDLKASYFRQAVKNLTDLLAGSYEQPATLDLYGDEYQGEQMGGVGDEV